MADVTITYKGANIATMDATGSKTLQTAGTYCEGDIGVEYVKPGGGGPVSVPAKEVNFRDYDGTVVYSYTPAEFAALTAMPDNPDHSGDKIPLTAQGWNWSFADAQAYVAKYGRLEVGQMYITTDGKTHVLIHLEEGRTSPMLGVCPNGTVDVDWGDGTAHDTLTGTTLTYVEWTSTHNYAAPGDYDIKLTCTGTMGFYGSGTSNEYSGLLRYTSTAETRNWAYRNAIQKVYCANNVVNINNDAFHYCANLLSVSIPNSVTTIGAYAFRYCYSLTYIVIPNYVTVISDYAFQYCYTLSNISISNGITLIGNYAFVTAQGMRSIVFPESIVSIGNNIMQYVATISSVTIPEGITSIGNNAFANCYGLLNVIVSSSVTSIGTNAFSICNSMSVMHCKSVRPPTLASTNSLNGIPADCIIYVPRGSLNSYKTATNWSTYASHMQEESQ